MLIRNFKNSFTFSKLPHFIKKHSIFTKIKRIEKPFAEIGLTNTLEKCSLKIDGKKSYIGFSSDGINGLWDIATMSMRGVCSCMHWKNKHATHLVGSLTDPFLGIVFITDNTLTPYGLRYNYRTLVRFLYKKNTKSYILYIDRLYKDTGNTDPDVYNNRDNWDSAQEKLKIMKKFIISKVKSNFPIKVITNFENLYESPDSDEELSFMPSSTSSKKLIHEYQSMNDSELEYNSSIDDHEKFFQKFQKQN